VIRGWTEGIPYFKGGSGILLVPAHLGYGNSDYSGSSVLF
jgi:FKBP-type peptidyl-prolyl cis-trans isomerase FkpA